MAVYPESGLYLHLQRQRDSVNPFRQPRIKWGKLFQTKKCIFVPGLGIEEDGMAREQIQKFYPDYKVFTVDDCLSLVQDGGALNCVTWNILADVNEYPQTDA